jgi:hypothetical protein
MTARTPVRPILLAALFALTTAACDDDPEFAAESTEPRNGTGGSGPVFNTNKLLTSEVPTIDTTGLPIGGVSLVSVHVVDGGGHVEIEPGTLRVSLGTLVGVADGVTYTGTDFVDSQWTFDVDGQLLKAELTEVESSLDAGLWVPGASLMIRNLDPERLVYTFRYKHPLTQQVITTCAEDSVGGARMVLFGDLGVDHQTGDVRTEPNRIYFGCFSGSPGKATLWGYAPDSPSLPSLDMEAFETTTRIVRADYCADGTPHTEVGKRLTLEDRWQINDHGAYQWKTEAIWQVGGGAKCLSRIRSSGKVLGAPLLCPGGKVIPLCPTSENDVGNLWNQQYGDIWTRIPQFIF